MASKAKHTSLVVRVYRFRLYPTRAQENALRELLEHLRELYNAALQERRDAYRATGKGLTLGAQEKELIAVREVRPEYAQIHTHLLQDVLSRLDRAFQSFFRRVRAGEKPGYPRFKGRGQYHSFTFKDAVNNNGAKLAADGKRVRLSGIGNVKIKLHRAIQGRIKTIGVTLDGDGHWYAICTCDSVPPRVMDAPKTDVVGVDVGVEAFVTISTGERIDNPRPQQTQRREVVGAQRTVARRKRGSKRRKKAVAALRKQHAKVARTRKDFHHKTAHALLLLAGTVAVEDLNVRGLSRGMLARSVHDAGWSQFVAILCAKAESAGRNVIAVNPAGTSQTCAACGADAPKSLAEREHHCFVCGYRTHRDHNAALNILHRAIALRNTAGALPSGRDANVEPMRKRSGKRAPNDPRSPSLAQ